MSVYEEMITEFQEKARFEDFNLLTGDDHFRYHFEMKQKLRFDWGKKVVK